MLTFYPLKLTTRHKWQDSDLGLAGCFAHGPSAVMGSQKAELEQRKQNISGRHLI